MIKHIQQCHYNVIPLLPKDLPAEYIEGKNATWAHTKTYRMMKMGCTADLESDIFILPPLAVNLIA